RHGRTRDEQRGRWGHNRARTSRDASIRECRADRRRAECDRDRNHGVNLHRQFDRPQWNAHNDCRDRAMASRSMSRLTDAIAAERRRLAQREADAVRRLLAYHDTILDALTDDLAAVTEMIETAIRNGEPVNIDWLRRQERYHRLMDDVQANYRQY